MDEREQRRHRAEQEALQQMNKVFGSLFRQTASYRYYAPSDPKNKSRKEDRYFYTTRKSIYKDGEKYISGVYRYNAQKQQWKAMKKAGHAKKKDAIARARKLSKQNA